MKIIERLRELEKKATGAPWHGKYGDGMYITGPDKKEVATACGCCDGCTGDNCENDRPFIIELRNALPALLAVAEAAEKLNKAIYPTIGADARSRWIIDGGSTAPGELDAALRAMEGGA